MTFGYWYMLGVMACFGILMVLEDELDPLRPRMPVSPPFLFIASLLWFIVLPCLLLYFMFKDK